MHAATLCMASESLLICISPFLRHLRNKWPWISLRGHSRSWSMCGTNRKRVYIFLLVVNSNLDPILHSFNLRHTDYGSLNVENHFPFPTPIPAKIRGCSLWSRSVMLGFAESEKVRLISREIIFAKFQPRPIWPRYLNVTDGRTDERTTCLGNTALRYASRGKNTNEKNARTKQSKGEENSLTECDEDCILCLTISGDTQVYTVPALGLCRIFLIFISTFTARFVAWHSEIKTDMTG